jgi:hypothetical protein
MVREHFDRLNSSRPGTGQAATPGSARPGYPAPSGTGPSSSAMDTLSANAPPVRELSTAETRIRDAPAIATVNEYDSDWHFVVIDGGKERNISEGAQLAVRREHKILGLIKVDEVLENQSVAELQGAWRNDAQAPKPRPGDDVITYPLF